MREQQCRKLYREAFADPDTAFEDRLFSSCRRYLRTVEEGGEVVSMLFALPCKVRQKSGEETPAFYVYAAATQRQKRGQGWMGRLLEEVKKEGVPLFLVPASEALIGFYKRAGFRVFEASVLPVGGTEVIPTGGFAELAQGEKETRGGFFTAMWYAEKEMNWEKTTFPYRMQ